MPLMSYNGVAFPHQETTRNASRVKYTDDGVDALHIDREVTVNAIITPEVAAMMYPAAPWNIQGGETFGQFINRVRVALLQPRKDLRIDWGGGVYLSVTKYDDRKNGPLPEDVSFTRYAGDNSAMLTFSVRCATPVCEDRSRNPRWISNRWTELLTIDPRTWARTWTRRGTLHVHPDAGLAGNADIFRGIVTPPIRQGFLRVRPPEYELASDGLALRYTVADEEQYAMPPTGAVSAEGNASVTANMGIFQQAEVTVKLAGSIVADKYRLLETATVVAMQKLKDLGVRRSASTKTTHIMQAAIRTALYRNEVEVYFRAYLSPPPNINTPKWVKDAAGGLLGVVDQMVSGGLIGLVYSLFNKEDNPKPGDKPKDTANAPLVPKGVKPLRGLTRKPYGYDSPSPDPGLGGAGLALLAAALQDPCLAPPTTPPIGGLGVVITDPNSTFATSDRPKQSTSTLRGGGGQVPGIPVNPGGLGSISTGQAVPVTGGNDPSYFRTPELAAVTIPDGYQFPDPVFSVVDPADLETGDDPPSLSALYTQYEIDQRVVEDEGLVGRTEMRKGGLTRFIPVHAPTMELHMDYVAERVGELPQAPPKDFGDPNFVYLRREYKPGSFKTGQDGVTSVTRIAGTHVYGVVDPSKAEVGMSIAPWAAELMGKEPKPIFGTMAPPASDPDTGEPTSMDEFRAWRDGEGDARPVSG